MSRFCRLIAFVSVFLATFFATPELQAQTSRADSAAILLEATRRLELEGEYEAARELLDLIIRHFSGTPAATEAEQALVENNAQDHEKSGRSSLIVFNTLYGAFLGVAFPAAFGAELDAAHLGVRL